MKLGSKPPGSAFLRGSQAGKVGDLVGIGIRRAAGWHPHQYPILVGGGMYLLLGLLMVLFYARNMV